MSMAAKFQASVLDRRTVVVAGARAAAALAMFGPARAVAAGGSTRSKEFQRAIRDIVGDGEPVPGTVDLKVPRRFDNGHAVPFSLVVDAPMTQQSHIERIDLLSTANPVARVATFYLSASLGVAEVSGRFRLAKSQDVFVLARRNDGALFVAQKHVKVTIGGCT